MANKSFLWEGDCSLLFHPSVVSGFMPLHATPGCNGHTFFLRAFFFPGCTGHAFFMQEGPDGQGSAQFCAVIHFAKTTKLQHKHFLCVSSRVPGCVVWGAMCHSVWALYMCNYRILHDEVQRAHVVPPRPQVQQVGTSTK
eukprot:1142190-Pelagomonas_calceolata.AAC.5